MVSAVMLKKIEDQLTKSQKDETEFLLKHFQGELTPGFCCRMSILKIKS